MNETMKKLQNLTGEQQQELSKLATKEEGMAYLKSIGIEPTPEEIAEFAGKLPDDALDSVAGGNKAALENKCKKCGARADVRILINNAMCCKTCRP